MRRDVTMTSDWERWFPPPEPSVTLDGVEMPPGWKEPFGRADLEWCEEDAAYFERKGAEMRAGPHPDDNAAHAFERAAEVCDEAAAKRRRWAEVIRRILDAESMTRRPNRHTQ